MPSNHDASRIVDENGIAPCVKENHGTVTAVLKYQRTEYAKKIRKDYEAGLIKERRCNMREYALRTNGLSNTITTVPKDNYLYVGEKNGEE